MKHVLQIKVTLPDNNFTKEQASEVIFEALTAQQKTPPKYFKIELIKGNWEFESIP